MVEGRKKRGIHPSVGQLATAAPQRSSSQALALMATENHRAGASGSTGEITLREDQDEEPRYDENDEEIIMDIDDGDDETLRIAFLMTQIAAERSEEEDFEDVST